MPPEVLGDIPLDSMGFGMASEVIEWTWWSFGLYMVALVLHLWMNVRKWRRDQLKVGFEVSHFDYFRHYKATEWVNVACAIGFFWMWAYEKVGLGFGGAEFVLPHVPSMSFVVGWFSDSIARHVTKAVRNVLSGGSGNPPVQGGAVY